MKIDFSVAVDFTGSNGQKTLEHTFHYADGGMGSDNDYTLWVDSILRSSFGDTREC